MFKNIFLALTLAVMATFAQTSRLDSIEAKIGPVVFFGIPTDSSDYNTVVVTQPVLYKNKTTRKDTIFMDEDTTRYFYTPRILVVGFYTTYRNKTSVLLEGMDIVTSLDEMYDSIRSRCDKYSLIRSANSKCMIYMDNIPTYTEELSYVVTTAHDTFLTATGCNSGRDCTVYPLSATVVQ